MACGDNRLDSRDHANSASRGVGAAGDCLLDVVVGGAEVGGEGQTQTTVTVLELGDVDGSGGDANAVDKQLMNKILNGVPLP
jgi:hypothetical protein